MPEPSFRLFMQPSSFCAYSTGMLSPYKAFFSFHFILFFIHSKAEAGKDRLPHKWSKPSLPAGKQERYAVFNSPRGLELSDTAYHSLQVCLFTLSGIVLSVITRCRPQSEILLQYTSISSSSITASSGKHRSATFVQVQRYFRDCTEIQGQASCFVQKSPRLMLRVVFVQKTLYLLIPTLESTRNEIARCKKKTH